MDSKLPLQTCPFVLGLGPRAQGGGMQIIMTAMAVIAGLVFSLGISLLVEELIFGKVFPLVFARTAATRARSER